MQNKPAIVVVAFNRKNALKRVLKSISNAIIPEGTNLLISIDGGDNSDVVQYANEFNWTSGRKKVITHIKNIGLRKHVIECGSLVNKYGSIIMLEDDLTVSPYFYLFSEEALRFYNSDQNVAGISLYSHQFNVNCKRPFEPVDDGFDVFWFQFASSWGQVWNKDMWNGFYNWYSKKQKITKNDSIPTYVIKWPETSWLKYYIKYLVDSNKYFVYPRISLTSNHSDVGSNVGSKNYQYQVNMQLMERALKFSKFEESKSSYDSFFELLPEVIKKYNSVFSKYEFDVDLYGTKDLNKLKTNYLLSTKEFSGKPIYITGRNLWPHDMNVLLNTESGKEIIFGEIGKFINRTSKFSMKTELDYFFGDINIKDRIKLLIQKVTGALLRKLKLEF